MIKQMKGMVGFEMADHRVKLSWMVKVGIGRGSQKRREGVTEGGK